MKAAQFKSFGAPLEVVDLADPVPPPAGAVIEVEAAGICRSDWHAWKGHDPDIRSLPHVLGHEFSGTIAELAPGVEGWEVGERVTVPFACGCGTCRQCTSGNSQVCPDQYQPGVTGAGAFAEYVAVPFARSNLVRLPEAVDFASAASLGCRFATAFRALAHADQANLREGERVAVFGCGGVGLSAVMIAKALGAEVVAVDIKPSALERATALGADMALLFDDASEFEADVAIDAIGSTATCLASIDALSPRGRHIQIGLMLGEHRHPPIPMDRVVAKELKLIGSHGMSAASYPEMLSMIAENRLAPAELIAGKVSLSGAAAALQSLGEFDCGPGISLIDDFR